MSRYSEDTLVQRTTADYLRDELGWESVYAYDKEDFGPNSLLGRSSQKEVVLTRYLRQKLVEFNPGLPDVAYDDALRQITSSSVSQSLLAINREKYDLLRDGVKVSFTDTKGKLKTQRLRVFDFDQPENNHFLAVRELWVKGDLYRRRPDVIGFVNGLPLIFMELKNINRDIRAAYEENFKDYNDTVPHLFHHNAIVILANGTDARIGALGSRFEHFHEWKRLDEGDVGVVDMETLLKGICTKRWLIDLIENFIVYDESAGETKKIIAHNHQFLGVNQAIAAVQDRERREGKLGVFWHTQGSGKSYSMVFFTRKIHRKLGGNFTFLICTDRKDLDSQIYKTFAGCGVVNHDSEACRVGDSDQLPELLGQHKAYLFTLIQKFSAKVNPEQPYSERDDIIVITDEAHRTQNGLLSLNMRNALPKANYIGFTGTPLFSDDEITRRTFGDYVSTYDFQRAVADRATVPLFYDARGDKLRVAINDLDAQIEQVLANFDDELEGVGAQVRNALSKDYLAMTAEKRLRQIAQDFVEHYSTAWESGKAMFVCLDKITCVRMHAYVSEYWQKQIGQLEVKQRKTYDDQESIYLRRQIAWMKATHMAVVVSEEQGEVELFRKHSLDIVPHRQLIKDGFRMADGSRIDVESAFKQDQHPFRVVFVCAMWLTGFDVPSLSTLYLDKPLKAHTLMQAIARANRVYAGKNNGLIVDYCGILKHLRKALATFTSQGINAQVGAIEEAIVLARPVEELLVELTESIELARGFLLERNVRFDDLIERKGFALNAAIQAAKEAANESDQARKRFETICRAVFSKFLACITIKEVNRYRQHHDALAIVYRSLQQDRELTDIREVMLQMRGVIDQAIQPMPNILRESQGVSYDISQVDFERLRKEFEQSPVQRTTIQNLQQVIEARLQRMLQRNGQRIDLQSRYEEIVAEYNSEKDRKAIEVTFEELLKFIDSLNEEEQRAVREGLDEETLAIFDLLVKPELGKIDIRRIKEIATDLLVMLKREKLRIQGWRDKEATVADVRATIYDFLYREESGLPLESYSDKEIEDRTEEVFKHLYRMYPTVPSPYYDQAA